MEVFITFVSNFFHYIQMFKVLWNLIKKKFNSTALICAATGGHINIVKELLKQQYIDTNIKDILNYIYS